MIGKGSVMAIGGNESKRGARSSILGRFIDRAGGEDARIVVIPSASESPRLRAKTYERIFRRLGAAEVRAVHAEHVVTSEDREAIRNATGIFVTGGDQVRLMECLRATHCIEPIRETVRGGAVYAGTSAGASAASQIMIACGEGELVELGEGLGLVPDVIIDQHFAERQRLSRLMIAATSKRLVGVGVDEDTAIVWDGHSGHVMVHGVGTVTMIDRSQRLHVLRAD
jgi:cyanophycinase